VGYALKTVTDGMSVIVERVDAPFFPYVRVRVELDSVYYRVTQGCVCVFVVNLCPQGHRPFFVETQSHLVEQPQVILH
jgi:hypothetical protein